MNYAAYCYDQNKAAYFRRWGILSQWNGKTTRFHPLNSSFTKTGTSLSNCQLIAERRNHARWATMTVVETPGTHSLMPFPNGDRKLKRRNWRTHHYCQPASAAFHKNRRSGTTLGGRHLPTRFDKGIRQKGENIGLARERFVQSQQTCPWKLREKTRLGRAVTDQPSELVKEKVVG